MNERPRETSRTSAYLNAVLTVIALLLAALVLQGGGAPGVSEADAGDGGRGGIINPADQRRQMIQQLGRINDRLGSIQERLDQTMEVDVVAMPRTEGAD